MSPEAREVVAAIEQRIPDLASRKLGDEFYYCSLPLCVIDAVFSIQAKYTAVQAVVRRWCECQSPKWEIGPRPCHRTHGVGEFLRLTERRDPLDLAANVYKNRGRTSSKSGILKAEAVQRYCVALSANGIDGFADMQREDAVSAAWGEIQKTPGHSSGIAFGYFRMLAGHEELIKPDTRLRAFVTKALDKPSMIGALEAHDLIMKAYEALKPRIPDLTPRQLDYAIWDSQRNSPGVRRRRVRLAESDCA